MLLHVVLLTLVSGLHSSFTEKGMKPQKLSSLRNIEETEQLQSLGLGHNDLVRALQSQRLHKHECMLHKAYDLIHQQAIKLSQQEDLLRQQTDIVDRQRKLLEHLLSEHPQIQNIGLPNPEFKGESELLTTPNEMNSEAVEAIQTDLKNRVSSVSRVETRSDDGGPLEAVMNQMSQKILEMDAALQSLKTSYHQIENAQASTFVHWGSSQCSSSSDLVYSGVVGGSHYSHSGGAVNYLCLTMHPVPSNHTLPSGLAYLYGSEYYTYDEHNNKDPVCAVCRSRFSTTVMVPGSNVCSDGWTLNYSGFLMAGAYNQASSTEYICVDSRMESRVGGDALQRGMAMYFTATQCGTLPCQPYDNNKVVTCAVCSK